MENNYTNSPYQNNPYANRQNLYPNAPGPAPLPPVPAAPKTAPEDTAFTKKMKSDFPFFGIGSALYALFYAFCLYRNASGITYPFFVAGTLCYFFCSMKKFGVPCKRNSVFYIVSIILLGVSNCLTASRPLLAMNKCGIFLLAFCLMIHTVYADERWNFPKYLGAILTTIKTAFSCLLRPFDDMTFYFDAQKQAKTGKKSYFLPVLAGIGIMIPVFCIMLLLLASADSVFSELLLEIFGDINFATIVGICAMVVAVFFASYAICAALARKTVREEVRDLRTLEPITAIIVTAALAILYLAFSIVQILYLFLRKMQLPEGYSYSAYAREGFFQLLAVCILNLLIVLICLYLFRENTVLKGILTVISGCTYIMILSSALRMLMYISRYNLTFLRIFVLWALAVIFLLMAGVTLFIYKNSFPLFTYSMAVVTVFYIGLSFAHPDYWIAKYNLDPAHLAYLDDYDVFDSKRYLCSLSADAAPILLSDRTNPYLRAETIGENGAAVTLLHLDDTARYEYENRDVTEELNWLQRYHDEVESQREDMHLRSFNFSVYTAGKYLIQNPEILQQNTPQ